MVLRFTYSADDFLAVADLRRPRWVDRPKPRDAAIIRCILVVAPLVVLVTLALYIRRHPRFTGDVAGWMAAAGLYVAGACVGLIATEGRRRRIRRMASFSRPITMTLDTDGISRETSSGTVDFDRWDWFDRVVEEGDRFFLHRHGGRHDWLVIPARSVGDPAELRQLLFGHVYPPTAGFPVLPAAAG